MVLDITEMSVYNQSVYSRPHVPLFHPSAAPVSLYAQSKNHRALQLSRNRVESPIARTLRKHRVCGASDLWLSLLDSKAAVMSRLISEKVLLCNALNVASRILKNFRQQAPDFLVYSATTSG